MTDPSSGGRPRVLIYSGKGGVGKTTIAAATGQRSARLGKRTIILSVDIAHSLGDAFDVTEDLLEAPRGEPFPIEKDLWIQELDVQEEIFRHWDEVMRYFSVLFTQAGLDDVMAEELAIVPGMEDVIALLYLNDYVQSKEYDVIVLDLAPTGESLRFVSMPNTMDWYMRRVFRLERNVAKVMRPIAKRMAHLPMPDDSYYQEIERLWKRMEGVDQVLVDPATTSVRLVTNAEQMVVKESERAFMYFNLYGVIVDGVIVNRLLSEIDADEIPPLFARWVETHHRNLERIRTSFAGLPILTVPYQTDEVVGSERLEQVADALYGPLDGGIDPTLAHPVRPPFRFETTNGRVTATLHLPNLDPRTLDLWSEENELIVRVGSQKRHIPLPRSLRDRSPEQAGYHDGELTVVFKSPKSDASSPETGASDPRAPPSEESP